jgi:hypothetical protein
MYTKFLCKNLKGRDLNIYGRMILKLILTLLMPSPNLKVPPQIAKSFFPLKTRVEFMNIIFLPKGNPTEKYTYQWNAQTSD